MITTCQQFKAIYLGKITTSHIFNNLGSQQLSWESVLKKKNIEILEPLGGGNFGKVFRCHQNGRGDCAVKLYLSAIGLNHEVPLPSDIQQELDFGKRVRSSPYFATLYDWHRIDDYVFSLWDLGDCSLADYTKKEGPITRQKALQLMLNPAKGLDNLHAGKYEEVAVHGDIKPDNLFVYEGPTIKIGDFGISKTIDSKTGLRHTQRSPHYSLPIHEDDSDPERDRFGFFLTYAELRLGRHAAMSVKDNERDIILNLIKKDFFLNNLDDDEEKMIREGLSEEGWNDTLEKWLSCLEIEKPQIIIIPPGDILNAIAKTLGKKPEKVLYQDYEKVTELELSDEFLTDLNPLTSLTNLTKLKIEYLDSLTDISPLSNLANLTNLTLDSCSSLSDLSPLANLTNLTELSLRLDKSLTDLTPLASLINLNELWLGCNDSLTDLTPLTNLTNLGYLELSGCDELTDLAPLSSLINLTELNLSNTRSIKNFAPLSSLINLNYLQITGNNSVANFSPLAKLINLIELDLRHNDFLTDLTPLASLINLNTLYLSSNDTLTDLTPLAGLNNLTELYLYIYKNEPLIDITPLLSLKKLTEVIAMFNYSKKFNSKWPNISEADQQKLILHLRRNRKRIHKIEKPQAILIPPGDILNAIAKTLGKKPEEVLVLDYAKVTELELSDEFLTDLTPLTSLTNLTKLKIEYLDSLTDISPLSRLTNLTDLTLDSCHSLIDLSPLANLANLDRLTIDCCPSLTDLIPLANLLNLTMLRIHSKSLIDLAPLSNLNNMKELYLNGCNSLTDLNPIANLINLTFLGIGSTSLTDLSPLANLNGLKELRLDGCKSLNNLYPLSNLNKMRELGLRNCISLTDLSPLANLNNMEELYLSGCNFQTDLRPLLSLNNLTEVHWENLDVSVSVQLKLEQHIEANRKRLNWSPL
jgi:Leucine-rich repeat (LRR) protein